MCEIIVLGICCLAAVHQVRYKHSDQKSGDALCVARFLRHRFCVAGLEQGGGEAAKNMPVACFSARGKVLHPGQNTPEIRFQGCFAISLSIVAHF